MNAALSSTGRESEVDAISENDTAINAAKWRNWIQKGKLRDRAAARKYQWVGGIAVSLIALGTAFYFGAAR
jgi:hypothetical protein